MKRRKFFETLGLAIAGGAIAKSSYGQYVNSDSNKGKGEFKNKFLPIEKDTCYVRELGSKKLITKSNDWFDIVERSAKEQPPKDGWRQFALGGKFETLVILNNCTPPISKDELVRLMGRNEDLDVCAQLGTGVCRFKAKFKGGKMENEFAFFESIKLLVTSEITFYTAGHYGD